MALMLIIRFLLQGVILHAASSDVKKAHVGSSVSLPCRVNTSQCGDLHSVKWYRDTSRIYVFSQVGEIARAEGDATERMSVLYTPDSAEALLKITPVTIQDEASYKCEITYLEVRENCDVVQIIKLQTLVAPESIRVLRGDGVPVENATKLEQMNEETKLELICEAIGGKPIPRVTWYNGSSEMKGTYTSHDDGEGVGTGRSKLQITLSRGDLRTRYECKVESDALDQSVVTWLEPQVKVKPLKMELSGLEGHVVQGTNVYLICDVFGAYPAAEVKWFNNSDLITDTKLVKSTPTELSDGTFVTKSSLIFEASRWENMRQFHCYSENSVMKEQNVSALHGVVDVKVYYPPVVTVSPENVTTNETGNIILHCSYIANPTVLDAIVWAKDGQNLSLSNKDKYELGSLAKPHLRIKSVSRDDMGTYTCICKNSVGSSVSEDFIYVNVQFAPSVEVQMDPPTPVRARDRGNVTLVCDVASGNPSALLKVRWYLGGEMLKELPECNYSSYDADGNGEGSGGPLCNVDPSLLSLEEVGQNFAGNYTCQGQNIAGWGPESEPKELIVFYPPGEAKISYTPSKIVKGASVTLECAVSDLGRPKNVKYLWFRGSYPVPEVITSSWTIAPVTFETESNFTCLVVNEGGQGAPATVSMDVFAPPAFIQNLPPYQGVLMSSKNISLTCRVECSPLCTVDWLKDGRKLDVDNNHLYYTITTNHSADLRNNDFESAESTLIWNMTAWPGEQLDRTAPNSNYTCRSSTNGIGPEVNSTIEIAVDYPPENLTVSTNVIIVDENNQPARVICSGKGVPALSYVWKRNSTSEPIIESHILKLGPVTRKAAGSYICEATNKHGTESITAYLNVQYIPECTIVRTNYEGNPALLCTVLANPQEVSFTWKIRGANDTQIDPSSIHQEGIQSYLVLDSSVDSVRTYQCYANNTVGEGGPCELDVTGVAPWWKRFDDNMIIIIASVVAVIICVIIVCIIIICVCRRKRARNKYSNPVELEEREKSVELVHWNKLVI